MGKRLTGFCLIVATVFAGCEKQDISGCHRARVIRVTCASIVLQFLDNSSLGEDNWVDIMDNNRRHDNVFTVSNPCQITSSYKTKDTIFVKVKKAGPADCVRCALYDAAPATSFDLTDYSKTGCSGAK